MRMVSEDEKEFLLEKLRHRFEENRHRHTEINWMEIENRLRLQPDKLASIEKMEISGGEPDVIGYDKQEKVFLFCDCSIESPKGRRSFCYDLEALVSRKKHKPQSSAVEMASEMGIELLDEQQYRFLQSLGHFDTKTSSWLKTPENVRRLGGAIFGDFRFGRIFIYHNGAESYYALRGFRGILKV